MSETTKPINPYIHPIQDNTLTEYGGMTLRDHFAGLALQSLLIGDGTNNIKTRAREAYELADEMLIRRELNDENK